MPKCTETRYFHTQNATLFYMPHVSSDYNYDSGYATDSRV